LTIPPLEKPAGRTSTLLAATIRWSRGECDVFVRNLSEMGALIECETELELSAPVILNRDGQEVEGSIAWTKHPTYGVKFYSAVVPSKWLSEQPSTTNEPPGSGLKKLHDDGVDTSQIIDQRLGEEIDYAVRLIETASNLLANDGFLCSRHARELQNLSVSSTMLLEISKVIKANDKLEAVSSNVTGPMKNRILR
jgi:hypothetical protein